jgi:hypothetical protein
MSKYFKIKSRPDKSYLKLLLEEYLKAAVRSVSKVLNLRLERSFSILGSIQKQS